MTLIVLGDHGDLTQRHGRIERVGNINPLVHIFIYITERTFDAYMFQLIEKKQKMISPIMTSKTPIRSIEEVDEVALSYAEIKALASGNKMIIEKTELDAEVSRLKLLKQNYLNQKYDLEDKIAKVYPVEIEKTEKLIENIGADQQLYLESKERYKDNFPSMIINGQTYYDKEIAGKTLLAEIKKITISEVVKKIGYYRGFQLGITYNKNTSQYNMIIQNKHYYQIELSSDIYGNLTRIENVFGTIEKKLNDNILQLPILKQQLNNAMEEVNTEFKYEGVLKEKQKRLDEVNISLNINEKDDYIIFDDTEEIDENISKKEYVR